MVVGRQVWGAVLPMWWWAAAVGAAADACTPTSYPVTVISCVGELRDSEIKHVNESESKMQLQCTLHDRAVQVAFFVGTGPALEVFPPPPSFPLPNHSLLLLLLLRNVYHQPLTTRGPAGHHTRCTTTLLLRLHMSKISVDCRRCCSVQHLSTSWKSNKVEFTVYNVKSGAQNMEIYSIHCSHIL